MRSYHIGSADSEILQYKQTDKQTDRHTDRQTNIQTNRQTDRKIGKFCFSTLKHFVNGVLFQDIFHFFNIKN